MANSSFTLAPRRTVRSVTLRRDLPTVPGASSRALAFGLSFSSLALALRAEAEPPALPLGTPAPCPDPLAADSSPALSLGTAPVRGRGELFFIDAAVADPGAFWLAAPAGATVVAIPAGVDSWQFMATEAQRFQNLGAIHIISHGEPGALVLNGRRTTAADLAPRAALLRQLGAALSKNGDILLYGCDTGSGAEGRMLVTRLADFTGADVAASSNPTGGLPGADWNLEITRGTIETPTAAPADYAHTLHTASVGTIAQLKAAITTAVTDGADDTITITANLTFASSADAITINVTDGHTLSIVGGGFTLSGGNLARILNITGGSVAISNLTIANGFVAASGGSNDTGTAGGPGTDALGAGIRNAGTLTISGSTITANKAAGGGGAGGSFSNSGGGGGGGGFGTTLGGTGGTGRYSAAPTAPTAGHGGNGGGTSGGQRGGYGGSTTGGGGGSGLSSSGYTDGGAGGTANNGTIAIGGGGGGSGGYYPGGDGGSAAGGIFNTGTLTMTSSSISGNIAAGGGGGGGGAANYSHSGNGGAGGHAVGGLWNSGGTVRLDSGTAATLATGNKAGGGHGGVANGTGNTSGADGASDHTVYNVGGSYDPSYSPADTTPPTVLSIVRRLPSTAQLTNSSSATFRVTFSEAVTAPTTANFAVAAVGSNIVGTVSGVATVSTSVYDVAVTITSGTGEFRLKVVD